MVASVVRMVHCWQRWQRERRRRRLRAISETAAPPGSECLALYEMDSVESVARQQYLMASNNVDNIQDTFGFAKVGHRGPHNARPQEFARARQAKERYASQPMVFVGARKEDAGPSPQAHTRSAPAAERARPGPAKKGPGRQAS